MTIPAPFPIKFIYWKSTEQLTFGILLILYAETIVALSACWFLVQISSSLSYYKQSPKHIEN